MQCAMASDEKIHFGKKVSEPSGQLLMENGFSPLKTETSETEARICKFLHSCRLL